MVKIVGQDEIIEKINTQRLPQSLILCGECGSGRHTICRYISEKYSFELSDITNSISLDTICDAYDNPIHTLYIIDSSRMSVREQNVILKFLEEPPKCAYIIIICEKLISLLPTIVNRCTTWNLGRYTKSTLTGFFREGDADSKYILEIAKTPGDIERLRGHDLTGMMELANKIFSKIVHAK